MKTGVVHFERISDVTFQDVVKFLKDPENAKHAKAFFKKNPGSDTFSFFPGVTNWRREAAKNPDALRDLIITGGEAVRSAMVSEKLFESSHVKQKPEVRSEMLVLLQLMGKDVQPNAEDFKRFYQQQRIDMTSIDPALPTITRPLGHVSPASELVQQQLERCLVDEKTDQVKLMIAKLVNDKNFKPLANDLIKNLDSRDSKFVVGFMNALAELKDPNVNSFILEDVGKMKNFSTWVSEHPNLSDASKGLIETIKLRATAGEAMIEYPFVVPGAPGKTPSAAEPAAAETKPAESDEPKGPRPT